MQISFCATKRHPSWSQNSLRYKLKYLENQENYFNQKGLMCRVFKNLSYEMNLYQQPCSPLKRCYSAFHFIFYTMILFMKLKDLHGQVMVKNEVDNIITASKNDQTVCVNLNTFVDVNSYSIWDKHM